MKKLVKLSENQLLKVVRQVIEEQSRAQAISSSFNQRTPPIKTSNSIKNIKAEIAIDCDKKVVTKSNLPKPTDRNTVINFNKTIIDYYCNRANTNL